MVIEAIPEHRVVGKPLGRHREHDPRSRSYRVAVDHAAPLRTVHHRRYGHPFDQGNLGSCTGNAVAGALNTKPLHVVGSHLLGEEDAVAIYELATQLDGFDGTYPPDDTGSSGLAAAKAAQQKGLITSYRHAFGIDDALQALQDAPVITGVDWYESFDNPAPGGLVEIAGQVRGGHEFEIIGFDAHQQIVYAENSWGIGWGVNGRFHFSVQTWDRLLAAGGDATVLVRVA